MDRTLDHIRAKLEAKNIFLADSPIAGQPSVIGYEKEFRLRWFATQLNTFLVATDYGDRPIDVATIENHAQEAFGYAKKNRRGWPRGLQSAVGAISILISSQVTDEAIRYCQELRSGKRWAGFAIPVVHDTTQSQTHHFTKTPLWGRIYFPHFRSLIEELSPP